MPVPVARPVNLLHDFATRLYDYLGGNNTHHAHCCWSFRLMRHAEGGATRVGCVFSPPLHDLRKIPIHFARMSQMVRDASAIVVIV